MRTAQDLARELTKIHDTMVLGTENMILRGRADATLHMAREVRYNPLTVAMIGSRDDLERIIAELQTEGLE